jgi:hypothetical protein
MRHYYSVLVLMLALVQEQDTKVLCPGDCICYKWTPFVQCSYAGLHHLPEGIPLWYIDLDITNDNISILYENEFKLADLLHLQTFKLISSQLATLQGSVFSGMINLTLLDLTNNSLHTLQTGVFCGLESVRKLSLSKNKINSIFEDAFCALSSLQILNLDENKLSFLEDGTFQGLRNLTALSLRENVIEAFSDHVFEDLHKVMFLDLTGNNIKKLNAQYLLQGMESLLVLYLSDNNLTCDCELKDTWHWFANHNVGSTAACARPAELSGQSWIVLNHTSCSGFEPVGVQPTAMYVLIVLLVFDVLLAIIMFVYYHRRSERECHSEAKIVFTAAGSTSEGIRSYES